MAKTSPSAADSVVAAVAAANQPSIVLTTEPEDLSAEVRRLLASQLFDRLKKVSISEFP